MTMTDFETGFETSDCATLDFCEFDGTTVSAGCVAEVIDTDPYRGTYHAHFETDADGLASYAKRTTGINHAEIYARIHIKFKTLPTGNREAGGIYYYASGTSLALLRIRTGGTPSGPRFRIQGRNGAVLQDDAVYGDTLLVVDTWYAVEFYALIDASAGIYRVYVDGVMDLERTGYDTNDFGNVDDVRIGIRDCAEVVSQYVDCVVIDSSYIGPEPTVVKAYPASIVSVMLAKGLI